MTRVEFFHREPGDVNRQEGMDLAELSPGRSEHSLQSLHRFAALRLGNGADRTAGATDGLLLVAHLGHGDV